MAKYKMKSAVEAEQFRPFDPNFSMPPKVQGRLGAWWLEAAGGPFVIRDGDWIVTGAAGQQFPVSNEDFLAAYEPA